MALPSAFVGSRHTGQSITWVRQNGTPEDLTGAAVTARVQPLPNGLAFDSDGVFVVVTPTAGLFTWAYGALDVGLDGDYQVQFKATFGDSSFDLTEPQTWEVQAPI